MHMITHTKIKAHECDISKKKFTQKTHLVTHFIIHLEEKSFGCAECIKWFTKASDRTRHIQTCTKS